MWGGGKVRKLDIEEDGKEETARHQNQKSEKDLKVEVNKNKMSL